jgi:hypothetical protein
VVAPLFRHHAGHDIAAGNDVEDIAYIPIRFQSTVCSVVVVVVRLQIRAVRCRQCRRCGKGVNKGIFLRDLPQVYFVPGQYSSDNAIGVSILAAREAGLWLK